MFYTKLGQIPIVRPWKLELPTLSANGLLRNWAKVNDGLLNIRRKDMTTSIRSLTWVILKHSPKWAATSLRNLPGRDEEAMQMLHLRSINIEERIIRQMFHWYRFQEEMYASHKIRKLVKSTIAGQNRLWFCDFLSRLEESDFLHLSPSDELMCGPLGIQIIRVTGYGHFELEDLEFCTDILELLLQSHHLRLQFLRDSRGLYTKYWVHQ